MATPQAIENQLIRLSKDLDDVINFLNTSENNYVRIKTEYALAMAQTRMELAEKTTAKGKNYTVQEREDIALLTNKELFNSLGIAEATVKAARNNAEKLSTQVDIARSVGTSVRSSMQI